MASFNKLLINQTYQSSQVPQLNEIKVCRKREAFHRAKVKCFQIRIFHQVSWIKPKRKIVQNKFLLYNLLNLQYFI